MRSLSLALILSTTAVSAQAQEAATDEIVVTANKVEQNAQDVPIALTAFTGESLRELGINDTVEMARITPAEVRERYGVDPKQVPDFIALRGDPSDKLPGAIGVGPKGAADLIRKYGSLEAALEAGRFATQADALRLFRSIATMDSPNALSTIPSIA